MNRRDFLGSILGLFTTTQIPWIAHTLYDPYIDQPKDILKNYRTAIRLDNDQVIQGPGIKNIDEKYGFIYYPIKVHKELTVKKCILIYKNKIISEKQFDNMNYIPMVPGDTLNITHKCYIDYFGDTIKPSNPNWEVYLEEYLKQKELLK